MLGGRFVKVFSLDVSPLKCASTNKFDFVDELRTQVGGGRGTGGFGWVRTVEVCMRLCMMHD